MLTIIKYVLLCQKNKVTGSRTMIVKVVAGILFCAASMGTFGKFLVSIN